MTGTSSQITSAGASARRQLACSMTLAAAAMTGTGRCGSAGWVQERCLQVPGLQPVQVIRTAPGRRAAAEWGLSTGTKVVFPYPSGRGRPDPPERDPRTVAASGGARAHDHLAARPCVPGGPSGNCPHDRRRLERGVAPWARCGPLGETSQGLPAVDQAGVGGIQVLLVRASVMASRPWSRPRPCRTRPDPLHRRRRRPSCERCTRTGCGSPAGGWPRRSAGRGSRRCPACPPRVARPLTASSNPATSRASSRRTRHEDTNPVDICTPSSADINPAARSIPITSVDASRVAAAVTLGP